MDRIRNCHCIVQYKLRVFGVGLGGASSEGELEIGVSRRSYRCFYKCGPTGPRADPPTRQPKPRRRRGSLRRLPFVGPPHVLAGDRIAEDLIFERLREDGCRVTVISEEAGLLTFPLEGAPPDDPDGLYLIMDPLDGSILYERDVPAFWAISMGLWQGSRHLATLVMDLTSGQVWQARSGEAWESNVERGVAKMKLGATGETAGFEHRVASATKLSDAYVATYLMKPHYLGPVVERFSPVFLSSRFVLPIGGALAWTYVASGRLDAHIPLNQPLTEVYSAMGVAQESGCIITDLKGNPPKLTPDIHQRYTLVCNA